MVKPKLTEVNTYAVEHPLLCWHFFRGGRHFQRGLNPTPSENSSTKNTTNVAVNIIETFYTKLHTRQHIGGVVAVLLEARGSIQ